MKPSRSNGSGAYSGPERFWSHSSTGMRWSIGAELEDTRILSNMSSFDGSRRQTYYRGTAHSSVAGRVSFADTELRSDFIPVVISTYGSRDSREDSMESN